MNNKALKTLLLCGTFFCAASFTFGSPCTDINMKAEMSAFLQMVKDMSSNRMEFQRVLGQAAMGDAHAFDSSDEDRAWPIVDAGVAYLTLWVMRGNRLNSDHAENIVKDVVAALKKIDPEFIDIFRDYLKELATICGLRKRIINGEESTEVLVKYLSIVKNHFDFDELEDHELEYWKYFLLFDRPGEKSIISLARENSEVLNAVVGIFDGIIEHGRSDIIEEGDVLEDILTTSVDGDPLWLFFYSNAPATLLKLSKKAVPSSPIHSWKAQQPDGSILALKDAQAKYEKEIMELYQRIIDGEKSAEIFGRYCEKVRNYTEYSKQSEGGISKFLEHYLLFAHRNQPSILSMAFKNEKVWDSFRDIFYFLLHSAKESKSQEKVLMVETMAKMLLTQASDGTFVWEKTHYYAPGMLDDFGKIVNREDPRLASKATGVLGEKIRLGDVHCDERNTVWKAWDQHSDLLRRKFEDHNRLS